MVPRRARVQTRLERWAKNGAMLLIGTGLVRLLALVAPALAMAAAAGLASELGWGLFNLIRLPVWLEIALAIIVLDFAIWFQHLMSHKVPLLWRIHRVHHADSDMDASTALRFHPIEIAISAVYKLGAVFLLGPAVLAAISFEVILNASAIFNHSNLRLPKWADQALRLVLVTPDMHRVHHSIHRDEHDQNYGFCLSIWDRLFKTYTAAPRGGHEGMIVGLRSN
ncbi:MAG: sterol desaturase family protein [Pseudomonadota bacterium]